MSRTRPSDVSSKEIPLSWFGRTLWKYSPLYIELILIAACLRLIGLVEPFIFQVIIDRILPFQREASLLVVVAVFAAASLFQLGFEALSELLGILTANRVTREFGSRIFDHLFMLPLPHFRKWTVGETLTRIGETDTIRNFLVDTTTGVLLDLFFVAVYLGVLLALSVPLTLIVLAALPLQLAVYFAFGPFLRRRLRVQFDAGAAHQSRMVENISGIVAVKSICAEGKMLKQLDETLGQNLFAHYRVGVLNVVSEKLTFIIERSVTISIVFMGANLVFDGSITLGELIAFHLIAEKVTDPISGFSRLWESWQNIRVSRQRLGDIVNSPVEPFGDCPKLPANIEPRLRFENVSFAYVDDAPVLQGFNFEARPNSLSLIVGPSGIGKSTFGRLAAGIDAPLSGRVMLGGCNISEHDPHDVRTSIAYVPQEPYLFSGTLRDNLLIRMDHASDRLLEEALEVAAAESLTAELPQGLDTDVGEQGGSLSGGQRQRVAIARSILTRPRVLVLDEPTSALDETAQRKLAAGIQRLRKSTTLVVITHRPDVFDDPDQIFDFGRLP